MRYKHAKFFFFFFFEFCCPLFKKRNLTFRRIKEKCLICIQMILILNIWDLHNIKVFNEIFQKSHILFFFLGGGGIIMIWGKFLFFLLFLNYEKSWAFKISFEWEGVQIFVHLIDGSHIHDTRQLGRIRKFSPPPPLPFLII